jgi:hypothetical protein
MVDSERRNKNSEQGGFFTFIKQNLIYCIMFVAIVIALFYNFQNQDNTQINENKKIEKSNFPLKAIILSAVVAITFIIFMIFSSKQFEETSKKPINTQTTEKQFVNKVYKGEFKKIAEDTTQRELDKLYSNPKFRTMLEKKGDKVENWVWQTKEKEKKVVYRDRESSDEDDHLSQITISDDE